MSDAEADKKEGTELAPGDVTDFVVVLTQLDKGRVQQEASNALHEVVEAALTHNKKGGTVSIKITVNPLESGAVQVIADVTGKPVKDPAGTIFFADGEGHLSRDNAGLFYGIK
ncbi:hypothetical protein [Mycolicibacterium goodii]|uniref:Uncharacterized protein n=2 Tax=root TaxID=1 RepID=A0A0F6WE04_9CAUD|nr:hypothetical protein [Mycolicibacterium goodii]YP_009013615.1 hypothetical protein DORI_65 [Mycobacterium phage Dori]YP_009198393.1 hypothetical protein SEA_PHAYONCE_49 [Mycobacterium phage Phayonce]UVT31598.1 hypothetical protein SEA_MASK_65 [Mycobacterium phage Mask]AER47714.1 hypothetical protein DORI_65 [Mycobacterium phage Dori]AKF14409.1 hypothetical protein SEA_PHAYONCE_49 [Mycobacterium phage Phayonce]MBU8824160.1 hypothetical protein [Mycolicibacterium goodii]MBU8838056.1 hypothe